MKQRQRRRPKQTVSRYDDCADASTIEDAPPTERRRRRCSSRSHPRSSWRYWDLSRNTCSSVRFEHRWLWRSRTPSHSGGMFLVKPELSRGRGPKSHKHSAREAVDEELNLTIHVENASTLAKLATA